MAEHRSEHPNERQTAVDDVRRVRERLSREANGDVGALATESTRVVEALRDELGLKVVPPPAPARKADGTGG
jgi:hypothetical protein